MSAPSERKTLASVGKSTRMSTRPVLHARAVNTVELSGWPPAFEAAARLGRAAGVFCMLIDDRDTANPIYWVCTLERTRGRKIGRGSAGKRRWREWWRKHGIIDPSANVVRTDWFTQDNRETIARGLGVMIYKVTTLPDNVHILEADEAAVRPRSA